VSRLLPGKVLANWFKPTGMCSRISHLPVALQRDVGHHRSQ